MRLTQELSAWMDYITTESGAKVTTHYRVVADVPYKRTAKEPMREIKQFCSVEPLMSPPDLVAGHVFPPSRG